MKRVAAMKRTHKILAVAIVMIVIVIAGVVGYMSSIPVKPPPTDVNTLVYATDGIWTTLDPAVAGDISTEIIFNVAETLVYYNAQNSSLEPRLATSWNLSKDNLTWTFELRKGVMFQDGTPFNATAVNYSLERTMKINSGMTYILAPIANITVVDPYTVQIKTSYPANLPLIMSAGYAVYIVSPTAYMAHDVGDLAQKWATDNIVGTGPYMVESLEPGVQATLVKFDGYWGGWAGNHVNRVIVKIVTEPTTLRLLMESGQIDFGGTYSRTDLAALSIEPGINVSSAPSYRNLLFPINCEKAPTDNLKVRQAISYAFDYDAAVKDILLGYGEQGQGPIPRTVWGHNASLPMYSYNLTKAAELLKEAGHPGGGFSLDMIYQTGNIDMENSALLWKDALSKIGVTLDVQAVTWDVMSAEMRGDPSKAPNIAALYWWPTYVTPYDWLSGQYESASIGGAGGFNWSYYNNSELDRVTEEAESLAGSNLQMSVQLFQHAQEIVNNDAPCVFVWEQSDTIVHRGWVMGTMYNPAYEGTFWAYSMWKQI